MNLCLGKKPASEDHRDLLFNTYYKPTYKLVIPSRFGQGHAFEDWKMLGNGPDETVAPDFNGAGDCVLAEAAHATMLYTKLGAPATAIFTGKEVISDYSALTGYVVGDESTDQGTDMRAALNYRRHVGVIDKHGKRHKIAAYVALHVGDWDQLLHATYVFGAIAMGFNFPSSAMWQFNHGFTWDVNQGDEIEGGHDVMVVGSMAKTKRATSITWGQRQEFTRRFYETYCDEAFVPLSEEILKSDGKGLHGFDLAALRADLAAL